MRGAFPSSVLFHHCHDCCWDSEMKRMEIVLAIAALAATNLQRFFFLWTDIGKELRTLQVVLLLASWLLFFFLLPLPMVVMRPSSVEGDYDTVGLEEECPRATIFFTCFPHLMRLLSLQCKASLRRKIRHRLQWRGRTAFASSQSGFWPDLSLPPSTGHNDPMSVSFSHTM